MGRFATGHYAGTPTARAVAARLPEGIDASLWIAAARLPEDIPALLWMTAYDESTSRAPIWITAYDENTSRAPNLDARIWNTAYDAL